MGIPSGGGFGSSSGSAFSQSGSGGTFDSDPPRRDSFYSNSYNDPFYYNNQRPYRESYTASTGGSDGCGKPCALVASLCTFCWSFVIIFGIFKSGQAEMGLNYSRVMSANSVFVKQIQIRNLRDPGPVVYSFSKRPALSDSVDYNETHDFYVESVSHKEWGFWLNAGSTIRLSYEVKGVTEDYIVLAFIRGREGLDEWTSDPNAPANALKWYRIHGNGVKDFVANKDDEYFVAFGNLNRQDIEVIAELWIHSTLYSVKGADKKTVFTSDVEAVTLPVPLFHGNSLLLTAPSEPQDGVDVWEVAVDYTARWATYLIIWGTIGLVLVVFLGIEAGVVRLWRRTREELPLLAPQEDQEVPSPATSYPPSVAASTPPGELDEQGERAPDDHQLCTICLDAPKDCFFDPCGHRCTCYTCGRRIQGGDTAMCPICRQPIRAVRKIFDS